VHAARRPSPFLLEHLPALRRAAAEGPVFDVASGRGRNALAVAGAGIPTVACDRDPDALADLVTATRERALPLAAFRTDLEAGLGIPVRTGSCGAILVFRFLFRPLCPDIERALAPGALLLYETFTERQRDLPYGPGNPDFLLAEGELPALFPSLRMESHWEGATNGDRPEHLARLVAQKPENQGEV